MEHSAFERGKQADMRKTTFTLGEAAEVLSCHKETLRRAMRVGELRAARLGREFRISRVDLQAFWTAQGGGALFVPDPAGEDEESVRQEAPRENAKKTQQPPGPRQLPLPTS
jgi:excisionase family DNA binding protein